MTINLIWFCFCPFLQLWKGWRIGIFCELRRAVWDCSSPLHSGALIPIMFHVITKDLRFQNPDLYCFIEVYNLILIIFPFLCSYFLFLFLFPARRSKESIGSASETCCAYRSAGMIHLLGYGVWKSICHYCVPFFPGHFSYYFYLKL